MKNMYLRFFESAQFPFILTDYKTKYDKQYETLIKKFLNLSTTSIVPYVDESLNIKPRFTKSVSILSLPIRRDSLVWFITIFTPSFKGSNFWKFSEIGPVYNMSTRELIQPWQSRDLQKISTLTPTLYRVSLSMHNYEPVTTSSIGGNVSLSSINAFVNANLMQFRDAIEYIKKYNIQKNALGFKLK